MRYSPWRDAGRRPGLLIVYARLTDGLGYWDPDRMLIVLDQRQSRRQRRCTLAHELAHVDRGDEAYPEDPALELRQEQGADQLAALRLLDLDPLMASLLRCGTLDEAAVELRVDRQILTVRIGLLDPGDRALVERRFAQVTEGVA